MKKLLLYTTALMALGAATAGAADEITPPIGNYSGVLELNGVIYPHPADVVAAKGEVHPRYDHPAVLVAKRSPVTRPVVTLHPALWH